ncbi:hypothetical protein [Streptomyces drozdowiczii]|uniref:Transposase n=1 Tax=Streptomyces drozdowiczii TaxID=202862 RepID=A0ABY6PKE7_9ACTN|nr:hypothetical protein [Streptomyces drozdowiczii]MCX0247878.1 hypothetical protein [Streptomyces drozdowiczii]UZK52763.1 hypothetical protein NEH16_00340 [Streptomyces drozdowiczii]
MTAKAQTCRDRAVGKHPSKRPSRSVDLATGVGGKIRRSPPKPSKHTVERIQKRLAEEHDFDLASYSTLRNYVRKWPPEIVAEDREGRQHLEELMPQAHLADLEPFTRQGAVAGPPG